MAHTTVNVEEIIAKLGSVPEITYVKDHRVACSGGGATGHPKVYFSINDEGYAECSYCDRAFIYAPEKV